MIRSAHTRSSAESRTSDIRFLEVEEGSVKRSSLVGPLLILAFSGGSTTAIAQQAVQVDVMTMPRPIEALDNVWIEELTMME